MYSATLDVKDKAKVLESKRLLSFNCYIKIEKNGIEIKNKFIIPNTICSIAIFDNKCIKNTSDNIISKNESTQTFNQIILEIRNKNRELFYTDSIKNIIFINDKLSYDGKLTIVVQRNKDKYTIFISKTTKELIDSLIPKLNPKNYSLGNDNKSTNININNNISSTTNINVNNNVSQNLKNNNENNKRRKYNELLKEKMNKKYNILPTNTNLSVKLINPDNKKILENQIKNNAMKIRNKNIPQVLRKIKRINDFPDYLLFFIFKYLDKKTLLNRASLINKNLKYWADYYVDSITIRDDTPAIIFNKIISRFNNAENLIFGKGKNFKNEVLKSLNIGLKNLKCLDISQIENLNDSSVKKLFCKTKVGTITTLKLNYYLESLITALFFILEFYKNINNLTIINYKFDKNKEKALDTVIKFPKYYHPQIFKALQQILLSDKHNNFNQLSIFVLDTNVLSYDKKIFRNLTHLSIDLLLIQKVQNIQIFYDCNNLVYFKLDCIAIKQLSKTNSEINTNNVNLPINQKIEEPNYKFINFTEMNNSLNNIESLGDDIDFDNDYFEVFSKVFYNMQSLKSVYFGQFITDDICKLISVYLKNLEVLRLSSNYVTDVGVSMILDQCKKIKDINLDGCYQFTGGCFFELYEFPKNLKNAKLSIMTHNFYHVVNFLRQKGVNTINYIRKTQI